MVMVAVVFAGGAPAAAAAAGAVVAAGAAAGAVVGAAAAAVGFGAAVGAAGAVVGAAGATVEAAGAVVDAPPPHAASSKLAVVRLVSRRNSRRLTIVLSIAFPFIHARVVRHATAESNQIGDSVR